MRKCLWRFLFTPMFWIIIPHGSRTVFAKSASVILAATSFLVPVLEASDVAGVCHLRCPKVDADADVVLPVEVTFALLLPFELSVSVVYDMTLFHNHATCAESVAAMPERWA